MFTTAPLFGKFHSCLKDAALPLQRQRPLHHLQSLCANWIAPSLLAPNETGDNSRQSIFTPKLTFMAFLDQVLTPGSTCRRAVLQIQASYQSLPQPLSIKEDTSAYCQARARWTLDELVDIRRHLAEHPGLNSLPLCVPGDRPLKVIDGTCVNAPDTKENRLAYPQSKDQKPQCGFPLLRLTAVFSLKTGALLEREYAPYATSENALYQKLRPTFQADDIVLGDRNFGSWGALADLKAREVDGIFRMHASRNRDFRQGQALGANDRLLTLFKPKDQSANMPDEEWEKLPAQINVRMVRFRLRTKNGRCKKITLLTTLLDPALWPVELLAAIYGRRWEIELFLRDIKTTLQMEMLSCLSPDMVHKELEMHFIAYNLIRAFMGEAALTCHVPVQRLSFKGSLDAAREYARAMAQIPPSYRQRRKTLYCEMLAAIARDPVPLRPDRFEPRCQKRRPKNYPFMTRPRHELRAARKDRLPSRKKTRA
jgi:hypothetical protein